MKKESLHFKIDGHHIGELAQMDVSDLAVWFSNLEERISDRQKQIATEVLKEIKKRIRVFRRIIGE